LIEAGKALWGGGFNILPLFKYNNIEEIQQSINDRGILKYAAEQLKMNFVADEWLQNIAHVRPRLAKWEYIRMLHETLNDEVLELKPIQVPYRSNDSWLAVEFPAEYKPGVPFTVTHDTVSITVHGEVPCFTDSLQSGLLIDEWTEMIPVKEEITGITFNYDQPNAMAPQCLLLAVPAEETGHWTWSGLVSILNDTVEPDMLDKISKPEIGVLLPAILANYSDTDLDLALDYRTNASSFANKPINTVNSSSRNNDHEHN
jgi:hypothetical protein